MPRILLVLIAVMTAQLAVDTVGLVVAPAGDPMLLALGVLALVVDLALIAAIARATEWIRRTLQVAAVVGAGIDALLLVGLWSRGGYPHEVLITAGLVAGSVFTAWALGRRDVQAWVFERWMARRGLGGGGLPVDSLASAVGPGARP